MMRRNVLSLIVFTVLVTSAPVASYAQQAYQFGKCEVAPANKEAALRALHITMPDGVKGDLHYRRNAAGDSPQDLQRTAILQTADPLSLVQAQ